MTRKRTYVFAGNDHHGLMRTIAVQSQSPSDAEKAAKRTLTNPRLVKVG